MVSINYASREVCCKIVYYGPGLSGKTTNLQYVHAKVPQKTRGDLISLATEADRTLYFDFLPINIGSINGFAAKFQLYTVPGQVYYNATRKLVLRGTDGIVFVADSQADKMDDNIESLMNLEDNLKEYGYSIDDIPVAIQFNKRDLPGVLSVEELNQRLNTRGWPWFEASATIGNGVFDTLKLIIKLVLDRAKGKSNEQLTADSERSSVCAPAAPKLVEKVVAPPPETPTETPAAAAASPSPPVEPSPAPVAAPVAAAAPSPSAKAPPVETAAPSPPPASAEVSPTRPPETGPRPYPGDSQRLAVRPAGPTPAPAAPEEEAPSP